MKSIMNHTYFWWRRLQLKKVVREHQSYGYM